MGRQMSAAAHIEDAVRLSGPLNGEGVAKLWPQCEPLLASALERDAWKLKPDQLLTQIADGLMGLYVVHDFASGELLAALACEVQDYPNARVFVVAYCGGHDAHRWAQLIGDVEREAARLGCHVVRIPGRKGWGRVFPEYRETYRVFEREILR